MSTAAQWNSDLIAAYLDAVIRKDATAVDRFFDPNVEYVVNGTLEPDAAGMLPPISADCQAAVPWLGIYHGRPALRLEPSWLICTEFGGNRIRTAQGYLRREQRSGIWMVSSPLSFDRKDRRHLLTLF